MLPLLIGTASAIVCGRTPGVIEAADAGAEHEVQVVTAFRAWRAVTSSGSASRLGWWARRVGWIGMRC